MSTVYLDLETTGLDSADEALSIAIVGDDGETLLYSLLKPQKRKRWPKAEKIHGITPQMVKDAPALDDLETQIADILRDKRLVIYNAKFDTRFLGNLHEYAAEIYCCMERYGGYIGEWDERFNHYKWHKLDAAAKKAGHRWTGEAHNALADAQATRSVWHWLDKKHAPLQYGRPKRSKKAEKPMQFGCLSSLIIILIVLYAIYRVTGN